MKDVTNHGHDLIASQKPSWEVVRWLSTCGNGVVEGSEECDNGDTKDGDGCSSLCKIEPGWTCSGNPSVCSKGGSGGGSTPTPAPPPTPTPTPGPTPQPAPSDAGGSAAGGKRGSGGSIAAAVLVPLFVMVLGGVVYAYRGAVYEQFPQVRIIDSGCHVYFIAWTLCCVLAVPAVHIVPFAHYTRWRLQPHY